jgi:hypothetical protein
MNSKVTHNPVLSSTFHAFLTAAAGEGFAAGALAPIFNTAEQAASYYVFPAGNALNIPHLHARAPGTAYQRSNLTLSDSLYSCRNYGHETPVPDETRKKYEVAFAADKAAVERNARIILINLETRVRNLFDSAAVTQTATPTVAWDAFTNAASDPVGDVRVAVGSIYEETGMRPNTLVLPYPVAAKLKLHPKIRQVFYGNTDGVLTNAHLAAVFEVKNVVEATAVENQAADGQTPNSGYIWGNNAYLAVSAGPNASLEEPSAARTFVWQSGGGDAGSRIDTYRNDDISSDIHRSAHFTDEKLIGPAFAYRFTGVLTV